MTIEKQVKSIDRVRNHGEVLTARREVEKTCLVVINSLVERIKINSKNNKIYYYTPSVRHLWSFK